MSDLKALKAIAALSLTADDIENLVNKLSALSVMTLGPVVACTSMLPYCFRRVSFVKYHTSTALTEDKVVGTEELTEWTSADRIHGTGFEIDQNGTGDIFVARCLGPLKSGAV